MAEKDFHPRLGRVRDNTGGTPTRLTTQVARAAGRAGARALRHRGHIAPAALARGMGTGTRAAAGLIAPGSRRVVVRARYSRIVAGDLGTARAHLKYIQRDGVSREGQPGDLYDARGDAVDVSAFLARSKDDPYQFRFVVSPEDSARMTDLKPFIRDLVAQMERDLATRLDWVAVDHFNTGHPHTHVVIRGRDAEGRDLVMARDYISHAVRARAQALVTLELGPEPELERMQKLVNEIGQERLTSLDRRLLTRARDGILVVRAREEGDPQRHTLTIGRLRTLERLGLAEEKQPGIWALDTKVETKLRLLGERADKFKMMQCALREAGIDRGAASLALFERGHRKSALVGKVVGVGLVDEITDRTWAIVDALDGRAHYVELGRLKGEQVPTRGSIVLLGGTATLDRPSSVPALQVLSPGDLDRLVPYEGPTWLDQTIAAPWRPAPEMPGFAAELRRALAERGRWLVERGLAEVTPTGDISLRGHGMGWLRQKESQRLARELSSRLGTAYTPAQPGERISGVYDHAIPTPTGKVAVIRREDTFTLVPWQPSLEPMRGSVVLGRVGPDRMRWTLDRGRGRSGPV